jgi:hypothetical protein
MRMQYNKALVVFAIMALGLTAGLIAEITTLQQQAQARPIRAHPLPCDHRPVFEHNPNCGR